MHAPAAQNIVSEPARPSLPPEVAREAQIAKLLTECEVFLRYGLKQKVVEQLRRVLTIDPQHVEARERLKDVLVDRGETTAAAAELVTLADQFAIAKPAVAVLYLRQALEIDPGNGDATARLATMAPEPPKAARPRLVPPPGAMRAPAAISSAPPPPEDEVFFVDDDAQAEASAIKSARTTEDAPFDED